MSYAHYITDEAQLFGPTPHGQQLPDIPDGLKERAVWSIGRTWNDYELHVVPYRHRWLLYSTGRSETAEAFGCREAAEHALCWHTAYDVFLAWEQESIPTGVIAWQTTYDHGGHSTGFGAVESDYTVGTYIVSGSISGKPFAAMTEDRIAALDIMGRHLAVPRPTDGRRQQDQR